MRSRALWAGAVAFWGMGAPLAAQGAPDAQRVMEAASELYGQASSVCADFVQSLSVPLLGEEHSGRGRLCQAQPDLFAMRFTQPEGDAVVADGTSLWIYLPSASPDQVLRTTMARGTGGYDFHREFLEDYATKYDLTLEGREDINGSRTYRVRLVPKTPAGYRSAVVWVEEGGVVRRVRVEEENGSVRTVTLANVEIGVKPPAGWFTFTPPAGVRVLIG